MKDRVYLDANIFIFASIGEQNIRSATRKIIEQIVSGKIFAITSCLTIDEVVWVVQKERPIEIAIEIGERIFLIPNLEIVEVNSEIIKEALKIMKELKLKPRDAIHAATMAQYGINTIISEDPHFEKINGVKRLDLNNAVRIFYK